jgi:hypothetical protein
LLWSSGSLRWWHDAGGLSKVNAKQCVALCASLQCAAERQQEFCSYLDICLWKWNIGSNVHKSNIPIFECQTSHKYSNAGMRVIGTISIAIFFALEGEKCGIHQCRCHSSKQ